MKTQFSVQVLSSLLLASSARMLEGDESNFPNLQDGLVPPTGMWRGATIDGKTHGTWANGADVEALFEDVWDVPLHIFRTFKAKSNAPIVNEMPWIERGGILFYSIQPQDYVEYGPVADGGIRDEEIESYADAIAAVKPHKVMVPVGFEPDLYVDPEVPDKFRGTVAQYKAMWRNFVEIFERQGADNVVWVMDFSYEIKDNPDLAVEMWPDNNVVEWLFFNVFQFSHANSKEMRGDCTGGLDLIYNNFMDRIDQVDAWSTIPWGLGAWGSNDTDWAGTPISFEDRQACILGVKDQLESGNYSKMKAAISFNSLQSRIDETKSSEMIDTFSDLLESEAFFDENDLLQWANRGRGLCIDKGGLCENSCDSRCSMSWPKDDPLRKDSEQAACRCNPDGLEYDNVVYEDQFQGRCKGCTKPWQGSCQWSWPWDDPMGSETTSIKAKFRCRPVDRW